MASLPGYRVKPFSLAPGQVDAIETAFASPHCRYIDEAKSQGLFWHGFSNLDAADTMLCGKQQRFPRPNAPRRHRAYFHQ